MKVEIIGPVFKCVEDKNIFLSRLYGLKGYVNVEREGLNLYLELKDEFADSSFTELQEICDIWNMQCKPLG